MASAVENPTALRSVVFIMATVRETILSLVWCGKAHASASAGPARWAGTEDERRAIQAIFGTCCPCFQIRQFGVSGPLRRNGTPRVNAIDATG